MNDLNYYQAYFKVYLLDMKNIDLAMGVISAAYKQLSCPDFHTFMHYVDLIKSQNL